MDLTNFRHGQFGVVSAASRAASMASARAFLARKYSRTTAVAAASSAFLPPPPPGTGEALAAGVVDSGGSVRGLSPEPPHPKRLTARPLRAVATISRRTATNTGKE